MSFYSSTWNKFCGHEGNVSIWDGRVLMPCFDHLCILVPCNCLLTIVSVYYTASVRRIPNLYGSEIPWPVILRFISTILIIISNIVQILLSKFVFYYSLSYALSIFLGVSSCAWCIHTVYIYRLRWMYWENYRGPKCVIYVCVINLLAQILHTYNVITMHVHKCAGRDQSDEYLSYVKMFCLVMYFGTLILKNNRYSEISELHGSLNISPSETRSLLSDRTTFYDPKLEREDENTVAEENSSWLSKLTFHWVQPIMTKGLRQKIRSVRDLYILPPKLGTEQIEKKFDIILKRGQDHSGGTDITFPAECSSDAGRAQTYSGQEVETAVPFVDIKYMQGKNKMTLFRALNIAFGMEYYMLGILKLLADIAGFAGPVLLNLLVSYIENHEEKESDGYFYAGGLMLCTFLGALFSSQFDYHCRNVGYKIRSAVITTIFKKSLSVNSVSVTKFSTGEIVNFMSTDTDRLTNFCPSFHAVWSLPFQICVSLYLLYLQVGLAFLTGLAFALILIPINRWIANKIGELSKTMMEHKDSRVKMMNEVLFGLKIIKLYAWEEYFKTEIIERRKAELKSLRGRKYLDAMCVYFWATTPVLISILTFTTYSLMGNQLTAAKVFTSLSLFLMLISPLNAFPWVLNGLVEAWVSLKRVENFVQIPDCDLAKYYSQCFSKDPNVAVEVSEAEFSWKNTGLCERKVTADCIHKQVDGTLRLTNINFSIQKGQFVGVIGKVGSGKSSVLYAVLSEMCKLKGTVYIDDIKKGMAVVTQEAWIQHATVRDNILFGRDFVAQKYQTVVDATALYLDFQALPAGDSTEVGENGVTLSGGQKSRIALARALYQDKDIYLLDDPLAAVDAHVAQQLYSKCIMGILRNKTRILCTHHVKYLTKADIIIVMDNGLIKEIGKPEDILSHLDEEEFCRIDNIINEEEKEDIHEVDEVSGVLVKEEEKETGVVKFDVYRSYWRAVGNFLAPLVLISLFFMQASRNVSDWWLSYWISHTKEMNNSGSNLSSEFYLTYHDYIRNSITGYLNKKSNTSTDDSLKFYLTIYGCLAGANSVFTLLRAFLFAYGGICAAQLLHHKLLCTILKAPMKFFDVTPIGRILNRFSSDLYAIDDSLPFILNIFLAQLFGILGTIVVTCYGLPWFALLLLPLGAIYYKIQQYYRHTSREIKRITTVTLSPIYAHFSETVTGLITIRAFREEERFQRENIKRLDLNQRAQFIGSAVSSWLSFRLQMMGVIMVTGISFIAVLQHHYQSVDPGLVGLAISYALSVTNLLSGVVNSFTETEKQAVSVERAQQYIDDIPSECWEGSIIVNPEWPSNGVVTFSSVYLKYRPNLPYALQNLSFKTYPAEKLGVVGRTGSGKSSLFQALFRIVELCSGSISIDDINVKSLNLTDLRRNLAIIPQDPFLFSGSVRKNLDPTSAFKDNALWNVLERCHLKDVVDRLGGLQADVAERGKHFSVGQRQLLCLARAMLKNAKVLCIDEATASVDMETDLMLQDTIRREFCQSTVLTIAHRINTILDCDRVLVMDKGQVRELDSPGRLLQEKHSMFYQLVHGNNQF